MAQPFLKMQGIGNDFLIIDDLAKSPESFAPITPDYARRICDRRFGVGADQILWLKPAKNQQAHARMEIVNADGSTAEMCGNGIRAVALYLNRHSAKPGLGTYQVETLAGLLTVQLRSENLVEVDMGKPWLGPGFAASNGEALTVGTETLRFYEVSMGNPHAVIFVDRVDAIDLERLGPLIETHPRFPKRTNVEFVQVVGSSELQVRVWERGAGVTLACGTGACASAVAALASGRARGQVAVNLPGGTLKIGWEGEGASVRMEGPAEEVFRGEYLG